MRAPSSGTGVFLVIALVLFLASLTVAGVVYVRRVSLDKAINGPQGLKESLATAREAFNSDLLTTITRFDLKLSAGNELLNRHVTLVPLFEALNQYTLKTVRFTSFDYESAGGVPKLILRGEAQSFESIALQTESYVLSRQFKDIIFSNLNVDNKEKVVFELSMNVSTDLISYKEFRRR